MTQFDKKMNSIFNISEESSKELEIIEPEVVKENNTKIISAENLSIEQLDKDLYEDYCRTRDNFNEIIDKSKGALDEILAIAQQSEKARDYEVACGLMKEILASTEKYLDIQKKVREIAKLSSKKEESAINVDKAVIFTGSTNELHQLIKDLHNKPSIKEE